MNKRSVKKQLAQALSDAEAAMASTDELSGMRMKLSQTRLSTLNKVDQRKHDKKVIRLAKEVTRLKAELNQTRAELADARAEITRLQAMPAAKPLSELERVLATYEQQKQNGGVQQ